MVTWPPRPTCYKSKEIDFNWIGTYLYKDFLLCGLSIMYVHGTFLNKNHQIKLTSIWI